MAWSGVCGVDSGWCGLGLGVDKAGTDQRGILDQGGDVVEPSGRRREDRDDEVEYRFVPDVVGLAEEDELYGGMSADEGDGVFGQAAIVIAEENSLRLRAGGESGAEARNRWAMLDREASSGEDGEPVAGVAFEKENARCHSAIQCVCVNESG
jgi:hypothetical protein